MEVFETSGEYLADIVEVHCNNLSGDLVDLGPTIVADFYRNGIDRNTLRVFLGRENMRICGLAVITFCEPEVFKRNIANGVHDAIRLVLKSRKLPFLRILWRKLWSRDEGLNAGPSLLYLAMDKQSRGGGRGRQLLLEIERALASAVESEYHLQVKCSNVRAINFYMSNDFHIDRFVPKRNLFVLTKRLPSARTTTDIGN